MAEPFLAEVKIIGFNFPPRGWAYCDGQILPINQNPSLYSLLGTNYGGDGRATFGLPDLRGRTPIHTGSDFALGQKAGDEIVTLTTSEMPSHNHMVVVSNTTADTRIPSAHVPAATVQGIAAGYSSAPQPNDMTSLNPATVGNSGGSQPHDNMQPFITLGFVIALQGVFPSRG
ncbi:phage tail protein [Hoeflea olei]|uniref:Phage tail protein n=1 Tax=Hoeflea olei TaxID=1480615 RepID=A0A1C1YTQ7_9HYPH|nr:tail fiber protein [Hoeflea olei]OCW56913.1 phage tail protein [Hoeflea olei]